MNDLPSSVRHSKTSLYADDTSIYVSDHDPATVGNMLEEDLRSICEWIGANGMKMNVAKAQLMVMCGHKKKHLEDQVQVHIGRAVLPKQDSVNYLGVIVDKQLSWKLHIANVRRVCLGKVAAITRASVYLPMQVRKMLYSSFVIPHLDYCSTVWHNCGAVLTGRVERIQNYALRVILKKPSRSDTMEMRRQAGLHMHLRTQKA